MFRFPHRPREVAVASPEEQVALQERRDRELEDYLDSLGAGSLPWCTARRPSCTKNMATGATTGDWEIDFDAGGFTTDGVDIITPSFGIYAFGYFVNWNASTGLDGTSRPSAGGIKIGSWQFEISGVSSAYVAITNQHDVFYSGTGDFDQTGDFYEGGLVPAGFSGAAMTNLAFKSFLTLDSWVGTPSGTIEWSELLVLVQLTTGTDA